MNKIKMILAFAAVLFCGGAWAITTITPKALLNFYGNNDKHGDSLVVDGWYNYSTYNSVFNDFTGQNGVTVSVENLLGNFRYDLGSPVDGDFQQGEYLDVHGVSHQTVAAEIAASLGLDADLPTDVYKTGLIQGAKTGNTATITGLTSGKKYLVYLGFGRKNGDTYVNGMELAATGYASIGTKEYVASIASVDGHTEAATQYKPFELSTQMYAAPGGLMVVRLNNVVPTSQGQIQFTMRGTTSGINFVAIAEVAETNQMYNNQFAGRETVPANTYGAITIDASTGGYKATSFATQGTISGGTGSFAQIQNRQGGRVDTRTHTVAGWFKIDTLGGMLYAAKTANTGSHVGYKVYVDADGKINVGKVGWNNGAFDWNGNVMKTASACVTAGEWCHIAIAVTKLGNTDNHTGTAKVFVNGVDVAMATTPANFATNLDGETCDAIYMGAGVSVAGFYVDSSDLSSADLIKAIATDSTYVCAVKRPGFADWSNLDSTARCGTHFGKSGADLTFKLNPTTECPLGTTVAISTIKIANGNKSMADTITINGAVGTKQSSTEPFTPKGEIGSSDTIDRLFTYQFATPAIVAVGHEYPVEMTSSQLSAINDANSPILISGLSGGWAGYNGYCAIETQIKAPASFSYDGDPSSDWQSTGLEVAQDQVTAFLEDLTTDYAFAMTFGDSSMDRVPRNGTAVNPVLHDDGVMTVEFQVVNGGWKKMAFVGFKVDGGYLKVKRLTSAYVTTSFNGSMVTYSNGTITKASGVTENSGAYPLSKLSATPLVDPVATIGEREFVSLAKALKTAQSEATSENRITVTLLKGVDGDLSVPEWVTVDAGSYEISGKIIIAANAQVTIAGTQTTHGISGSGKLVKNGTEEVKVGKDSSNNSISGVTVEVNGGTLWLGHSSVTTGATVQNCTFVLNGGTLNGYGWPTISGVTFECRQNATVFSGTNAGFSIENGSFTKTGSGALTVNAHLKGDLAISIEGGSFTVPNDRSIANTVNFTQATLGSDDTWTAPNAFVISGTVSGSGAFNADLTLKAGSTINVSNGTVSLADGKSLTFPEGELNLVGVGNGDTVIRNVTSTPNGLSTAIVKIGGEAVGHLEYDAENHTVVYSTNTVTEVTPNITDPANLDSNGNFLWTSGAIWNTPDGTLPEGARIVFDAAEIAGVVISGQTEAGEIYVTNSDTANHPFVFHNHTKEVDGTHEIDDKIDCLTATSINVETFNGELGLRVPIKGDIMFGPSTTLKFIAGADKDNPSKAYAYSITGRAAAIQVALDTDAEAGWFVVPESMYTTCQFAPQDAAVTLVYDVADGEKSTTSPISNNQGSIAKTGAGTLALTSNISQNVKVIVEEGTLKLDTLGNYEMKGHLIVREHAKIVSMRTDAIGIDTDNVRVDIYGTLDMNGTRWTLNRDHANDIYFYPGSSIEGLGQETYGALDNATANKTNLHFVKNGDQGGTVTFDTEIRFRDANGFNAGMEIEEGMTVDYVNAVGFRTGSGTLNLTGGGVFNIAAAASINNLNKIKLGLGMTLNVAAGKTITVEPIDPTTTVIVETVNQDESKTYVASPVVAKIIVDETTTKLFASVDTALAEATVDQVVTICANIPGDLTVPEDKKADAGSYTIGGAIEIGANATLTVSGNRETMGIAGPGTFIVTSGTITAKNKSGGYAVDGATIQIDGGTFMISLGNDGAFEAARGDASAKDATFVIGENGTLTNYGYINLVGTITFDTAAEKGVFLSNKGFRGTPAIVKSGSGTLTFLAFRAGDSDKFVSLTLNGGVFKLNSAVVIDKLISGVEGKRVAYDEDTRTYSLVDAVTPIKPGTETEPQQTKPTEEELAQYAPTPVNAEAEAAGQASILKVVSKETAEGWVITVDLDETKMHEGQKVEDTAVAFAVAGLDQIAGSTTAQQISVPAGKVTPGAYYSVIYGDSPTALSGEGMRALATSEGVTITVPAMTDKKVQFFRVKASAYPTANAQ